MNLFQIIREIEKVDPEIMDRLTHRRSALTALGDISKKMALAAAPIAIGSAFNKAMGQQTLNSVNDVLNYALLLEYLEEDFYAQALAAPTLAANLSAGSPALGAIQTIKAHETAHVALLKGALGANANPRPSSFNFGTAFATYASFLTFAQAFEDTGVRAYKGQATKIKDAGNPNNLLTIALQIHSVEARHASHVRYMRRAAPAGSIAQYGWVTNAEANGAPAAVYGAGNPAATFPAESNLVQGGLTLTSVGGNTYTAAEVSEAFDEGLDNTTVVAIARSAATF
ncbi:ferritin-like domain-containing protein [Hymenobacter metallilatus]|uniref:Ferritin-like domain-containing protein n=1 Tax=Hymenobacter metallilatus TaxID=2493666 RepID=A0A3R9NKG9_9BACT|nr:ferritin-like domain-containing protein [Hymenobacter metallilatus]RSK35325.1 ferritin-like domain-containing protein [Hymenobacter metallilatus]